MAKKKTVSPRTSRTKRPRNTYTHYNVSGIMHSSQTDFKCIRRYKYIYTRNHCARAVATVSQALYTEAAQSITHTQYLYTATKRVRPRV